MGNLMDAVAEYFTRDGWVISRNDEERRIRMAVSSDQGKWPCVVTVDEENKIVFFHSVCPLKIPTEKRVKLAEFLVRVNRLSFIGHFTMDFDSGEIRFETYVYGTEETVNPDEMESSVGRNLDMMDKYLQIISKVTWADITPAEAITEVMTGVPMDRRYLCN